jgi:DNA polymerase-3 subunit beta
VKVTVKQSDLTKGLSTVAHAVSSRSTLPILVNILIVTDQDNNRVKLGATNLEIGITTYIPATVDEPGSTTSPAKTLSDLVNSLRPIELKISVDETHTMSIEGSGVRATVRGMDASEYPQIPDATGDEEPIILDAKQLKEMVSCVAIAAATDDARPVLSGVLVETNGEELVMAAADAFRLATMSCPQPTGVELGDSIIVPAKTMQELAKILPNEGTVQMIVTPNRSQVLFHTENVDMVSRLIEGTFPNFRSIIPRERTTRAVIETKEFAAAVKTVTPFAKDSSNIARIKIDPEMGDTGTLTIEANAEDIGSNVSTIPANVDGPEQEIIFNVKYLSDVLSVISTPEVALEIINAGRPGAIKPVGGQDYTYIIMPMSTAR